MLVCTFVLKQSIMHIKEIVVSTNNISQTKSFYTDTLQFKVSHQTDTCVSFNAGTSILTFQQDDQVPDPVYHFAFNIPQHQLQEAMNWLTGKAQLLPITDNNTIADFSHWNANAIYFYDNNGNLLEFIARHDLVNDTNAPFFASSIECISEIGLVADQVPAYTDHLITTYQLSVYAKQPRNDKFTALGDDHGLLIIVEAGRNWFPTTIPAGKFPVKIVIGNGSNTGDDAVIIAL
jgi:catechol-2,3-dioxygenase